MKRLAIFVEGFTEVLFVKRLIDEIANQCDVVIQVSEIRGGKTTPRKLSIIQAATPDDVTKFYILVVDCGGDALVATRIREEHEPLTRAGYEAIIGVRDVYPDYTRDEIPHLRRGVMTGVKTKLAPVQFILAEMEVEAWFLSEHTHFERVDPALTPSLILERLGFDTRVDDLSLRETPADDLRAVYGLVGIQEEKPWKLTINALDVAVIYLEKRDRIACFGTLAKLLDDFLTGS